MKKKLKVRVPSNFSVSKARLIQRELSKKVIVKDMIDFSKIQYVAGVDVAYVDELAIGAVSVHEFPSLYQVEVKTSVVKARFPYIPTLLSFRELHPAVSTIKRLKFSPDVFLVDGHGLAHPYRLGFASHLGVVINKPTIGVAKKRLIGEVKVFPKETGETAFIMDKEEVVGAVFLAKKGQKPIYISVGHMVSLQTAIRIVKACIHDHRLPEPIRMAHQASNKAKNGIVEHGNGLS